MPLKKCPEIPQKIEDEMCEYVAKLFKGMPKNSRLKRRQKCGRIIFEEPREQNFRKSTQPYKKEEWPEEEDLC